MILLSVPMRGAEHGHRHGGFAMARLPFSEDPQEARRTSQYGSKGQSREADPPLSVSQLSLAVKSVLANSLPRTIRVVGQVSNLSKRTHWFFSLKDDDAAMRAVCFATAARKVGFPMTDGMEVVCTGRVDFYEAQGNIQFYVDRIEPVGLGTLELRFQALCNELRRLGYFDQEPKLALPPMPQRVAVVTSRNAAALADVTKTASNRWPGCRLYLFDVRVQGEAAPGEIAAAIDAISKDGPQNGIEAIILTRGGGSIEDLWAFNERIVADAVFDCRLPIVAAIGHETDTTVAELVSDVRCSTPTQAAMTLIPDQRALEHQLKQLTHRLSLSPKRHLQHCQQQLDAVARHPLFRRPQHLTESWTQRLDHLAERLSMGLPRSIASQRDRLTALGRQLEAVGPINVLRRGFSYTIGPDGQLIRNVEQVGADDRMTTVLAEGRIESRVVSNKAKKVGAKEPDKPGVKQDKKTPPAQADSGAAKSAKPRQRQAKAPASASDDQASLF
jgi:exodeoxyribonuclease VII large subunit